MAQLVVNQKWSVLEEMATRSAIEFIPDTRAT